jgi:hypothetical protein
MAALDKLPDEILLQIFSYLSIEQLSLGVRNVCTRWRELSEDDHIWKHMTYSPKQDAPEDEILFMLGNMAKLRKFHYCGFHNVIEKLSQCCRKISVLIIPNIILSPTHLKLTMKRLTELTALHILINPIRKGPQLTNIIGESKTLLHLVLRSSCRKSSAGGLLKPIADGCPSLKTLKCEAFYCPNSEVCYLMKCKKEQLQAYSHSGLISADLIKAMIECTNLKSVAFFDDDIDDKVHKLPPINLTQLQNLTALQLSNCGIHTLNKISLTLFINVLPRLTYIGLPYADGNIDTIANEIILKCPLLTHLDLEGNDELECRALRNIGSCKMLKFLDVSRCIELGLEAMTYIAEGCPGLELLDVSGIPISEGMFQQIVRCSNLKTLLMMNCYLAAIDLNLIPTNMSGISYLYIGPCFELQDDVINVLRAAMPHLLIYQASFVCGGEEYFRIKTDLIQTYF